GLETGENGEGILTAFAGTLLSRAANLALEGGWTGMEELSGIPGSVGGAVYMNAGAYGRSVSDVLWDSDCFQRGEITRLAAPEHRFGYRESVYKEETDRVCLGARFRLTPGDPEEIRRKMQEYSLRRRTSQPLELPSAGSVFKRPAGYFAGKLIEDAGLKGARIGGAEVSKKHAGFIVNAGGAAPEDVLKLIRFVQKTVYEKDGVKLEPEVELLGDFLYEEALPWNS
ncbi:MAG: UDP-N-acetylmuramate dehydrogenase, partial [Clostridia bacterium]|nr:UDP-N-acetylmuramate dehydrogenase [Clostridia bacterium]